MGASIPQPSPSPGEGLQRGRITRVVLGLASLYGLRLLGMYLVLPVLSLYAGTLRGSTALLVGMSLGIYGFSQALFQIPFGIWSDRYGRRRAIVAGLLLFALGSVIAAQAHSMLWLIIGRFLQGSGAVASALVALMADLSGPRYRARAMGTIGVAVGLSFSVGMVFGPAIYHRMGAPALFWLMAVLSLVGALYVMLLIPRVEVHHHDEETEWTRGQSHALLHHVSLLRLDTGIFVLHLMVTAAFVVGPTYLARFRPVAEHGRIYAPIVLGGVALMAVSVILADRWARLKETIIAGSVFLVGAAVFLTMAPQGLGWCVAVIICMVAGIALAEPAMAALLTHLVKRQQRGTAAGIFHTSQFLGSFIGGMLGGAMLDEARLIGTVLVALSFAWLLFSFGLPRLRPTD